jgi:hypothetical protein
MNMDEGFLTYPPGQAKALLDHGIAKHSRRTHRKNRQALPCRPQAKRQLASPVPEQASISGRPWQRSSPCEHVSASGIRRGFQPAFSNLMRTFT